MKKGFCSLAANGLVKIFKSRQGIGNNICFNGNASNVWIELFFEIEPEYDTVRHNVSVVIGNVEQN